MQAALRRQPQAAIQPRTAKPRLEGTRATLRALGAGALTLVGVHRH